MLKWRMLLWIGLDHAKVADAALSQLVERGAYRYVYTEAKRQSRGIKTRKQYYFEASEKS